VNFLRDPTLQFLVNISIALLGIFFTSIVSVVIYRRQQSRKGVIYKVISNTPLLSLKEEAKGKIKVLFGTKPVNNARLVILKVWNSENTPILPNEYIDPIRVKFGDNVEVLDAEVLEAVPSDIKDKAKASLKLDKDSVVLEPLLLNSKDSITLKFLLAQTPLTEEVQLSARIVGVNQIIDVHKFFPITRPLARVFTYFSYFVFLIAAIYFLLSRYEPSFNTKILYLLIFIICALMYILLFIIFGSLVYAIAYKESYFSSIKFLISKFVDLVKFMVYEKFDNS
jgi:hypothetical protein